MDNAQIAAIFQETATILEILDENKFKINAYRRAARTIEQYADPIVELAQQYRLKELQGVGKGLQREILQILEEGQSDYHTQLKSKIPPGIFDILSLPGMGPKKIQMIWFQMGITEIGELEYACEENHLAEMPGFGVKTQATILKGIQFIKKFWNFHLLSDALTYHVQVTSFLNNQPCIERFSIVGSVRRSYEIVQNLDYLVEGNQQQLIQALENHSAYQLQKQSTENLTECIFDDHIRVRFHYANAKHYFAQLVYLTGSKEHIEILNQKGQSNSLILSREGLFQKGNQVLLPDESTLYSHFELPYITPELRENQFEFSTHYPIESESPLNHTDIRGFFHCHTTFSDGIHTIEEMAKAALEEGYDYIGIAEHSQSAGYANGIQIQRLPAYFQMIDTIQNKLPHIRIFAGIESDIDRSGNLDYPPEILKQFDFVIASIHTIFRLSKEEMTNRIIQAIKNPYTTMLGHPTGRLLLGRPPYEVDMNAIIHACAQHDVIIEMNANPHRLDLDWRYFPLCKNMHVPLSVAPDAHRKERISDIHFGVRMAWKGLLSSSDIFNCKTKNEVESFLKTRKLHIKKR
jgi:DNA polymerase (family X)